MDAEATTDEAWHEAYGEVAWSGRRGAGVKSARSKLLGSDGGKRAVHRGELEVSRKAIAQGRPECSRCPVCSCAVLFAQIARETAGAASTRSSLRPLISRRANVDANLGRIVSRDRETVSNRHCEVAVELRSPDERSEIRDHSSTVPDVASLIRATGLSKVGSLSSAAPAAP